MQPPHASLRMARSWLDAFRTFRHVGVADFAQKRPSAAISRHRRTVNQLAMVLRS